MLSYCLVEFAVIIVHYLTKFKPRKTASRPSAICSTTLKFPSYGFQTSAIVQSFVSVDSEKSEAMRCKLGRKLMRLSILSDTSDREVTISSRRFSGTYLRARILTRSRMLACYERAANSSQLCVVGVPEIPLENAKDKGR